MLHELEVAEELFKAFIRENYTYEYTYDP